MLRSKFENEDYTIKWFTILLIKSFIIIIIYIYIDIDIEDIG